jgi:hypothetical protein
MLEQGARAMALHAIAQPRNYYVNYVVITYNLFSEGAKDEPEDKAANQSC